MVIKGYLPTSLLEWPGKISAVVFVPGCNFRCPFCHNRDLVLHPEKLPEITEKDIFEDLKVRKKWVDGVAFSIHGDEPVIIKKRRKLLHLPVKDIWSCGEESKFLRKPIRHERKKLKRIKCLTKNGFEKVSEILRHKTKSLYKVVCGPGNYSILATGSHSVFVVIKNGLIAKKVSRLKRGDWLLSPKKINTDKIVKQISVLDHVSCLKENRRLFQKRTDYWEGIVSQVGLKSISQLSREYGHTRKTIREYYRSSEKNFSDLLDEWVIKNGFVYHKTSNCKIPVKIEVSPRLGEFLGYAVAEGSVKREKKSISSYIFTLGNEPKLAKRILAIYRSLFSQKSGVVRKFKAPTTGNWQYDVILGNRIIGELIGSLVGYGFANKHIPEVVFNAQTDVKISFIKALVLGDGHIRIRQAFSQHEFSLKTGSRKLAADFIFLLKTINVFSWMEEDGNSFRIVVSQNDLEKIGVGQDLNLKYSFKTRIEGIPRDLLGYAPKGQKRIRREKLAIWKTLPIIKNKKRKVAAIHHGLLNKGGGITKKGKRLLSLLRLSEYWNFKEVKKIEKIKLDRPEYVYDLVVEGNHSFVGGVGGLLLHNTGGEPTLQNDLSGFLSKCKRMGFETMIETNGSRPDIITELLNGQVVDCVAMDVKGPFDRYAQITKSQIPNSEIKKSLKLIINSGIPFELRTTVVPTLHDKKSMVKLARQLEELTLNTKYKMPNTNFWFLQQFQPQNCLDPAFERIKPYDQKFLEEVLTAVKKYFPQTKLRGV